MFVDFLVFSTNKHSTLKPLKFAKLKYIVYLCIGNRYNSERYMNNSNNALNEAVYYILLALIEPLHGYGIMQRTAELSGGRLVISAGTLYGALSTLLEKGWIEQLEILADSRRKEYRITPVGRAMLIQELSRLEELVNNGKQIIKQ